MAEEYGSFGHILAVGNNESPSEEFTAIAQVRDIDGPALTLEAIEATHHGSPGNAKEFVPGLVEGGEVTFEICWDPEDATHDFTTGLPYLLQNRLKRNFRLITPVEAVIGYWATAFAALVTQFKPKAPVNGLLAADVTLKVTSLVTLVDVDTAALC